MKGKESEKQGSELLFTDQLCNLGLLFISCGLSFLICKMGSIYLTPKEQGKTHGDALWTVRS